MSKKTVKKLDATRAVVYIRVSTDDQHLGPKAQADACAKYAARLGIAVVDTFIDKGVSGGAPLEKCPALQSALDHLKALDAGVFLVAKRDRLARDVLKSAMVTKLVESYGSRIVSADGVPESDEPSSVLFRQILDAFSEYERAMIRARTKSALQVKIRRGEVVGPMPVGFTRDGSRLVKDPAQVAEHMAVRAKAQAIVDTGGSLNDVLNKFIAEDVKYRNVKWAHRTQIKRILDLDLSDL